MDLDIPFCGNGLYIPGCGPRPGLSAVGLVSLVSLGGAQLPGALGGMALSAPGR
jgi:hypothetical protein